METNKRREKEYVDAVMSSVFDHFNTTLEEQFEHRKSRSKIQSGRSEDVLQEAMVTWFRYQHPELFGLLFHIPNGGKRNVIEAAKFKRMGVVSGVADLFLSVPSREHHGLYIEVKTERNGQTENQKAFEQSVKSNGYQYVVARSVEGFIEIIKNYLS